MSTQQLTHALFPKHQPTRVLLAFLLKQLPPTEVSHVPHVRTIYQGEEISIEIHTLKVRGSYKNHKKQKEAAKYVEANTSNLLTKYNLKTNGIHIPPEHVANAETTQCT